MRAICLPSLILVSSATPAKVKSSKPRQTIVLVHMSNRLKRQRTMSVAGNNFWKSSPIRGIGS